QLFIGPRVLSRAAADAGKAAPVVAELDRVVALAVDLFQAKFAIKEEVRLLVNDIAVFVEFLDVKAIVGGVLNDPHVGIFFCLANALFHLRGSDLRRGRIECRGTFGLVLGVLGGGVGRAGSSRVDRWDVRF